MQGQQPAPILGTTRHPIHSDTIYIAYVVFAMNRVHDVACREEGDIAKSKLTTRTIYAESKLGMTLFTEHCTSTTWLVRNGCNYEEYVCVVVSSLLQGLSPNSLQKCCQGNPHPAVKANTLMFHESKHVPIDMRSPITIAWNRINNNWEMSFH